MNNPYHNDILVIFREKREINFPKYSHLENNQWLLHNIAIEWWRLEDLSVYFSTLSSTYIICFLTD